MMFLQIDWFGLKAVMWSLNKDILNAPIIIHGILGLIRFHDKCNVNGQDELYENIAVLVSFVIFI